MAMFSQSFAGRSPYILEEQVQGYGLMYPPTAELYPPAIDGPPGYSPELDYDGSAYDRRGLSTEMLHVDDHDRRGYDRGGRLRYGDQERDDRRHRDDIDYKDRERDRDRSRRKDRDRDRRRDRRDYRDRDRRDRRDRDRDSGGRSPTDDSYEGLSQSAPLDYEDRESRLGMDHRDDVVVDNAGSKWMTNTPTHTILLRCLPTKIDEKDIRAELMMQSIPVKDVRVMRRKETGTSRGFAFVEFQNTADAQRWMEQTQGNLLLLDKYKVSLYYSAPKTTGDKVESHKNDWSCNRCGAHNFKRRDYCFKCGVSREESEKTKQSDGFDQVGTNPCNTLIFRGLDALTTEETLMAAIVKFAKTTPKNIRIIRDPLTNTSHGYGFAELNTCQESTVLLSELKNKSPAFEVDGKLILVSFAKNTFNTVMATLGKSAEGYQSYDYSGYYDYSSYYGQQTGSTNSAAAVAQAAIQQAQAAKQFATPSATVAQDDSKSDTTEYTKYPPPDVSTYQYEETSGYYYDPSTGLYYDANSQYYYNAQTGQFMYWDQGKSTYLPAPTQASETDTNKETKKDKEKKEKVKVAKKIAKDMEKWAKSLNAQKGAFKDVGKKAMQPGPVGQKLERESATADAGFAILEKSSSEKPEENWLMPPPPTPVKPENPPSTPGSSLVDYGGGDSDSEEDDNPGTLPLMEQLIDWGKMACLLCKRQFNSPEMLNKHTQLSGLHKQNLETLMKNKAKAAQIEAFDKAKEGYRDRAKERRQKYGISAPPTRKKKPVSMFEDTVIPEQPTKAGLGQDNIGNKLLQKMGWSLGQGLGKAGQGIVDPIQASQRVQQAGLGARGANVVSAPGDTYKEIVKKTMFARFHEVE